MKKAKFFLILGVILLFTTTLSSLNFQSDDSRSVRIADGITVIQGNQAISITNDTELANLASSGTGLPGDPYIIENLVIDGMGSDGVYIRDTTAFFTLRNCIIYNTTNGIDVSNSSNGKLINNTITGANGEGIVLEDLVSHYQLINNTAMYCSVSGFNLYEINYITFINNTAKHNGYDGVYNWGVNHSVYIGNTVINSTYNGISFDDSCYNNTISYNTLRNNTEDGLYIVDDCQFNRILFNTLIYNTQHGLHIDDRFSNYNTFRNNTANYNGDTGIYSDEASHNSFFNNTANGNQFDGIYLSSKTFNYTFTDNYASYNYDNGFHLECANTTLTYNHAIDNVGYGIYLEWADNNTLSLNTANKNGILGIFVENSNDNNVTWNVLHENPTSVLQSGGSGNVIANNSAAAATLTGGTVEGDTSTSFSFTVVYTDVDNLAPFSIRVIIDGTPYDMNKSVPGDNVYSDGCTYVFTTALPEEPQVVSFEAYDITHKVSVTLPEEDGFRGVIILLIIIFPLIGLALGIYLLKKRKIVE